MLDEKKTLEDCEVGEGSIIMMIRIQHNSNSGPDGAKEGSFSHKDLTSYWSSSATGSSSYEAEEVPEEEEVKLSQSESDSSGNKWNIFYFDGTVARPFPARHRWHPLNLNNLRIW